MLTGSGATALGQRIELSHPPWSLLLAHPDSKSCRAVPDRPSSISRGCDTPRVVFGGPAARYGTVTGPARWAGGRSNRIAAAQRADDGNRARVFSLGSWFGGCRATLSRPAGTVIRSANSRRR